MNIQVIGSSLLLDNFVRICLCHFPHPDYKPSLSLADWLETSILGISMDQSKLPVRHHYDFVFMLGLGFEPGSPV